MKGLDDSFEHWADGFVEQLPKLIAARDKRIGTLLAFGSAGARALGALISPLVLLWSLLFIALMLANVIYLARRLRAHLAAMPATG